MRMVVLCALAIGAFDVFGYVPEPVPAKTDYEITALYYPGTEHMPEWDVIAQTCPERKPLLGWFDEGNPEAIDWQIKWAVEHGISIFSVDWYWNKGSRRLEHWVKGFQKARFRKYLKWYMMYANHNQPGSHSTEDQVAVTKYWIENYFHTPEYHKIGGRPVVCLWMPDNIDNDFMAEAKARGETLAPGEGLKRAMAISDKMVREAGFPGIHWLDMWRVAQYEPSYAERRRAQGFRGAMHYGIEFESPKLAPEAIRPSDTPRQFSYDVVVAAAPRVWEALSRQDVLPFPVIIPTGWDDRPRSFANDARVIRDRTPAKFAELCRQARAFCDRIGRRELLILPINEWQEGSYIEPNEEYGFGMYEAIRDAFCEKPAGGWPKNVTPKDVGMGPYDFPPMYKCPVRSWTFDKTTEGWYRQPYGGGEVENHDGCLTFVVNWNGVAYNIRQRMVPFAAADYTRFRLRMRITPNARAGLGDVKETWMRLKWGTEDRPIIGKGLVIDERSRIQLPVVCDGRFHEYVLELKGHPDWKGLVNELWLHASNVNHARVAIDWMRFETDTSALAWSPLYEPGCGGWIVSVGESPHDPGHVVSGGDMLGTAISFDGGEGWTPGRGLLSYEMAQPTFHPLLTNVVWMGSASGPCLSTDGGRTWVPRRQGMSEPSRWNYTAMIECILIDRQCPDRLLAFGGSARLWKQCPTQGAVWRSTNAGADWTRLGYSDRFKINFDVGNYVAANDDDPCAFVKKYADRLASIHIKDRRRNNGPELPFGTGDTPLEELFDTLKAERIDVPCDIELEFPIPAGSDAVRETLNCNTWCRKRLTA